MEVLWPLADCARAIAALSTNGALPRRTVLVPSERVAHALRRELIRGGLVSALAGTRFVPALAAECAIEYPVAGGGDGGHLLVGYVDLVVADADRLCVIDFKTDTPPAGAVEETYPEYARQVRTYATLLAEAGIPRTRPLQCGVLFTSNGVSRWVEG